MSKKTASEGNNVRTQMKQFWTRQSKKQDVCEISSLEIDEILGYLPDLTEKCVLELGSGFGHFTNRLAKASKSVISVDFIEDFVNKNKAKNHVLNNVQFICSDAMDLDFEENSLDVIFSNHLFMYLADDEIEKLTTHMLKWLKPTGKLIFCELCFNQQENDKPSRNDAFHRSPNSYNETVTSPSITRDGKHVGFDLVSCRSVVASVKSHKEQMCWLMEPATRHVKMNQGYETFKQFLDQKQYSRNGILRYEVIFGRDYISTGGHATTEEFCASLNLQPGDKVLDVGCGIGGSAFHMGRKYRAEVIGIDLSSNMVDIALERQGEYNIPKISFEVADATKIDYPEASFDVVYSRDTILHIQDKLTLFENFYKWLKPGGKVFITDYICGPHKSHSQQFKDYVKQRGYHLLTAPQYGEVLSRANFKNVQAQDKTDVFIEILERELAEFQKKRDDFKKKFSSEDYEAIRDGWEDKLMRCKSGDQKWGLFYGVKA